jgi:hypothetical protein
MSEQLVVPYGKCGLCGGGTRPSGTGVCVRCFDCHEFIHVQDGIHCMTARDGKTVRWMWMRNVTEPMRVQVKPTD